MKACGLCLRDLDQREVLAHENVVLAHEDSDQREVLAHEDVAQRLAGAARLAGSDERGEATLGEGDLKNVRGKSEASQRQVRGKSEASQQSDCQSEASMMASE